MSLLYFQINQYFLYNKMPFQKNSCGLKVLLYSKTDLISITTSDKNDNLFKGKASSKLIWIFI